MKLKFQNNLRAAAILLMMAAVPCFTSCSSTPKPSNSGPTATNAASPNQSGFGGQVTVDTIAVTNTVIMLDPVTRKIGFRQADGDVTTYTAGPDVVNFNQIRIGDRVKATLVEEVAVFLIPANSPQQMSGGDVVTRAQPGGAPGGRSLETLMFTARIVSINPWQEQITLQLPDGRTKTVTVSNAINLADFNPGDYVRVRLTQSLALSLEKP